MTNTKRHDVKGEDIQVELGNFTRIHHAILEKLALIKITGYEFSCLMVLFRETYGYNRKDGIISLSLWQQGTGIERRNLVRTLSQLVEKKIIYKLDGKPGRTNTSIWGFNKYTDQWKVEQRDPMIDNEKVCVETPFNGVCVETPFSDEKVCVETPPENQEKVYQDTPEKVYQDTPLQRKKETTTTTEGSGGGSFLPHQQDPVLRCWTENIDPELTPILISDLESSVAAHGTDEVLNAIATAVRADNKTMRYVKGVLNRRREVTNGHLTNGHHTREVLTRIGADNE